MSWLRALFTEGEGNPSIGSVCFFILLAVYAGCMVYAQWAGKPIVFGAWDMAVLASAIYVCKKGQAVVSAIKDMRSGSPPPPPMDGRP